MERLNAGDRVMTMYGDHSYVGTVTHEQTGFTAQVMVRWGMEDGYFTCSESTEDIYVIKYANETK